ncbi:ABC transporter substrate-binding protein [Motiliproteus sp. MSK22-1]|uniref:substrate-binding periplasmic protein n=1 Tax=Motiliproteus sp. MSK22-1 TaxID=1897630 RepID=UPI0009772F0E|nr:transporter substrate-binding domain-containing protein [Motiliproteus sp. MSK22-1]OMH27155.1 hypothetical protein BGP75_22850 [Motiliproteus sp. MSK22-1]
MCFQKLTIFAVFSLFLLPTPAYSDQQDDHAFIFAVANWHPFSIGERPPFSGIDIDIAKIVASELGLTLKLRYCPFERCLVEMKHGVIDVQSGVAFNEERAKYLDYINRPYAQVSVVFYVAKNNKRRLRTYSDLYRLRVGAVSASHYFEPFNSDQKIRKTEVYQESILPPMLKRGRIDAMIGTNPNLDYEILRAGYKGDFEKAVYDPDESVNIYFSISKKSPIRYLKPKIEALLKRLDEDGTINRIHDKYR